MASEGSHVDNILFIVEGRKTEYQYIKQIYESYYKGQYQIIRRSEDKNYLINDLPVIDINWIQDANIERFVAEYEADEYSDGISIVNSFKDKNDMKNYSEAFIIIDADLMDNSIGGDNARNKINLINRLHEIVLNDEDNIELLVSSPQLEAIVDTNDEYVYKSGESYKRLLNNRLVSGAYGELIRDTNSILQMNLEKYIVENVQYDDHSLFPLECYNFETNKIKVRSPLFHLIATKEGIYADLDKLREFFELHSNTNNL